MLDTETGQAIESQYYSKRKLAMKAYVCTRLLPWLARLKLLTIAILITLLLWRDTVGSCLSLSCCQL